MNSKESQQSSEAENTTPQVEEETWSKYHNDPTADLILVANDKFRFRVHSWYFIQYSGMVKDLFSIPSRKRKLDQSNSPQLDPPSSPHDDLAGEPPTINLDASEWVVRILISAIYSTLPSLSSFPMSFDDILSLRQICQMLQVTVCDRAIESKLYHQIDIEPWRAFRHAAETNDWVMARIAILNFDVDPNCPPMKFPDIGAEQFVGIPMEWIFELLRRRTTLRKPESSGGAAPPPPFSLYNNAPKPSPGFYTDWVTVSEQFFSSLGSSA